LFDNAKTTRFRLSDIKELFFLSFFPNRIKSKTLSCGKDRDLQVKEVKIHDTELFDRSMHVHSYQRQTVKATPLSEAKAVTAKKSIE
jgi:hypothetical protein